MTLLTLTKTAAGSAIALAMMTGAAVAERAPSGPIKLLIGFGAGGAVMAAGMKDAPTDGLTLGLAMDTAFSFGSLKSNALSLEGFTFITTTAASQFGILARADSGWKTMADVRRNCLGHSSTQISPHQEKS